MAIMAEHLATNQTYYVNNYYNTGTSTSTGYYTYPIVYDYTYSENETLKWHSTFPLTIGGAIQAPDLKPKEIKGSKWYLLILKEAIEEALENGAGEIKLQDENGEITVIKVFKE